MIIIYNNIINSQGHVNFFASPYVRENPPKPSDPRQTLSDALVRDNEQLSGAAERIVTI